MNSLTKAQKDTLTTELTDYLNDELSIEIGGFDAEFLTDFVIEKFSPYFYNQGLADAQISVSQRVELITEAIDELVQPIDV